MIEIKNKTQSPVQILVRSEVKPMAFTTLIIPGVGANQNVRLIADERKTEYIDRIEKLGLISTRYVPNSEVKTHEIRKGE